MKTNIALIGFMGVGKSTISKALADRFGKKLVETDSLVVLKAGKTIPRIFKEDGEAAFRKMESEVIKDLAGQNNLVIDCGGGVVLNRINIERLKQNAVIVWLVATPEVVFNRVTPEKNLRPLLQGKNTLEDFRQMMCLRQPYYEAAADIKIDTSESDIATTIDKILSKVKENAAFNS